MKAIILHDFTAQPEDLAITMTHLMNLNICVKLLDVTYAVQSDLRDVDWVILHCWMPDHQLPMTVQNLLTQIPRERLQHLRIIELPDVERAVWFHQSSRQLPIG